MMAAATQKAPPQLSQAKYAAELASAADAVRLASRVCEASALVRQLFHSPVLIIG